MFTLLHNTNDQHFIISAMRTVFWQEQRVLILSDLHLGKTTHFRKAGIAVPHLMFKEDLHKLWHCVQYFKPKKIIVVGDLFHSTNNKEHLLFAKWMQDLHDIEFILVKGNHDILDNNWYADCGITVAENFYKINNIAFVHDAAQLTDAAYTFSGHIHPGVLIKGLGRQNLRFPCFHFSPLVCTLPAFGSFTGLAVLKQTKKDTVYAIVEETVVKV